MITIKIQTESGTETWQATKFEDVTGKPDGWYIRENPEIQWSEIPYCHKDAGRKDVIQLLRKEKDVRY